MPEQDETNVSQVETGAGETGQVAADPGETDSQVATEEKKDVPYSRFKEVNDQKNAAIEAQKEAETQNQSLQQQFSLIQQQQVQAMPPKAKSFFGDLGLDKDDQPTVEQIEAFAAHVSQQATVQNRQSTLLASNQTFIDGKPDYAEKVGVAMGNQFMPSAKFQEAMKADPSLAKEYFSGALTSPQAAYRAVESYETANELAAMKNTAKEQEHQKEAALKTGPLSPSAVGGGGGIDQSLIAGMDPKTREGKEQIVGVFHSALEGDFDE